MKRISVLFVALAMVLGMSQCKKHDNAANAVAEKVFITFNPTNGSEKTSFDPSDGTFSWTGTEYIYVGGSSHGYIGYLTNGGSGSSTFSGNVTQPDNGETLHFFYLGNNKTSTSEITTIDFSKQDGTIGNVTNYHIAIGHAEYVGSPYVNAKLNMAMAIAYFNTNDFDGSVYIHGDGVYSVATVNYSAGTITGSTNGYNCIGNAAEGCYVAMIPFNSATDVTFDSGNHHGTKEFVNGIQAGKYYCDIEHSHGALAISANTVSTDVKGGLFSIAGTNGIPTQMVRFSKGNLQATTTDAWATFTYSFMANQYDRVESENLENDNYAGLTTVSQFGWGTTGSADTEHPQESPYYLPNQTTYTGPEDPSTHEILSTDFGPKGKYNLLVANHSDWGYCFGGETSPWFTLSENEWAYLLGRSGYNSRNNATIKRRWATVDSNYTGLVILSDAQSTSVLKDSYTTEEWNTLEAAGAVFLPAAGDRLGKTMRNYNAQGYYWSSTAAPSRDCDAMRIDFTSSSVAYNTCYRYNGRSVRLVRKVD